MVVNEKRESDRWCLNRERREQLKFEEVRVRRHVWPYRYDVWT